MTERIQFGDEEFEVELPDPEDGLLPGVDLDLGSDAGISGGDDLANMDEENLYGNDVLVKDTADTWGDEDDLLATELDQVEIDNLLANDES